MGAVSLEDDLQTALNNAATDNADLNPLNVVLKMVDKTPGGITGVVETFHALSEICETHERTYPWFPFSKYYNEAVSVDRPETLNATLEFVALRALLGRAIIEKRLVMMPVVLFLKHENVKDLCTRCPLQMPCFAGNESTPEKCYIGMHRSVVTYPKKLEGAYVIVDVPHPGGQHRIPLNQLYKGAINGR